ncbi:type II toxin-antitoxin system HicA family toxin [Candidatus Magnetominusculus dajiuhuensis]|uniref:type II toxin-antitoxin system HicA family toxin n=1 Tax=Candidatus Magnetominusculus dajiuhuensis TaxID=3137712 RepID=UPI003B43D1F9
MKLPCISGHQCIKALEKIGFREIRQRGSHVVLYRDNPQAQLVVPIHDTLDRGTLRAIIRHSHLMVAEFIELL